MTGSGKTGLCLSLLEEAAIDGIPALIIDPKGDLGNLLLTFPQLSAAEFRPWINEDDARRKGMDPDAFAAAEAAKWAAGLAEWSQDGGTHRPTARRCRRGDLHAGERGRASRSPCCARSLPRHRRSGTIPSCCASA